LRRGATYYSYTGVAADTIGTEQDTLYFILRVNRDYPVNVNARVTAVRTGTTDSYDIDLEGKVFDGDSYSKVVENATQTASKSLYQPETSMVDSVAAAGSAERHARIRAKLLPVLAGFYRVGRDSSRNR
jgi:hypothetical protein